MANKKQIRTVGLIGAWLLPVLAGGLSVWLATSPVSDYESSASQTDSIGEKRLELPELNPVLFGKRLQGPPPRIERPNQKVRAPQISWPAIVIENILEAGEDSIVVFNCQGNKYRCSVGETACDVLVEKIQPDSITISKMGQSKKINIRKEK